MSLDIVATMLLVVSYLIQTDSIVLRAFRKTRKGGSLRLTYQNITPGNNTISGNNIRK